MQFSDSGGVRKAILEMVGRGDSATEIELRLRAQADEKDLQYAAALVKVRDSLRSDKITGEKRPASAAA